MIMAWVLTLPVAIALSATLYVIFPSVLTASQDVPSWKAAHRQRGFLV
jgi:hypothetical protein